MNGKKNLSLKAALVSLLMFLLLVGAWQLATMPAAGNGAPAGMTAEQIEYQKMLGKDPGGQVKSSGFPAPAEMAATAWAWAFCWPARSRCRSALPSARWPEP